MPEAATTEFWKDLKPIQDVFKPDGIPEVFYADTTSDDMRYYVPLTETVFTRPLFISPAQNRWCDILMATGPARQPPLPPPSGVRLHPLRQVGLPRTRLDGDRWGLPLRGAGRGAHAGRLRARGPDADLLQRHGAADLAGRERRARGHFDVHDYIALAKAHYEEVGLGAAAVEKLFR